MNRYSGWLGWALLLVAALVLSSCGGEETSEESDTDTSTQIGGASDTDTATETETDTDTSSKTGVYEFDGDISDIVGPKPGSSYPGEGRTPDYYLCEKIFSINHNVSGYNWGERGIWCDPFDLAGYTETSDDAIVDELNQVDLLIQDRYPGLVIPLAQSSWSEGYREPVIYKTLSLIRVLLQDILIERNLDPDDTEIDALAHGLMAKVIQESVISHYKILGPEENFIRVMRGDSGHGHGISQVDDRFHFYQLFEQSVSWDLAHNLVYGMDYYVLHWVDQKERALNGEIWCVDPNSSTFYEDLARTTYSKYNGGPGADACRWQDSSASFYQNDVGYYKNYDDTPTNTDNSVGDLARSGLWPLPSLDQALNNVIDIPLKAIFD